MFDYVGLPSGPCKHLAYSVLGPRLMAFPGIRRQLPIDMNMFNSWFRTLVGAPKDLNRFVENQRSHRLGFYHEALWHFFLDSFPQFELIAHNLPIRDASRTIGEFDFILRNRQDGLIYHLEVATKYYLEHRHHHQTFWIGPSLKDRFDIKAKHLSEHQINLSETLPGNQALAELGVLMPTKVIAVGGMLFYQHSRNDLDPYTAPEHSHAYHVSLDAFKRRHDNAQWALVKRRDWLAPLYKLRKDIETFNGDEICNHLEHEFDNDSQPVMIARIDRSEHHAYYVREFERLFVTPDHWCQNADQSLLSEIGSTPTDN